MHIHHNSLFTNGKLRESSSCKNPGTLGSHSGALLMPASSTTPYLLWALVHEGNLLLGYRVNEGAHRLQACCEKAAASGQQVSTTRMTAQATGHHSRPQR
jgi:hypothetical protein